MMANKGLCRCFPNQQGRVGCGATLLYAQQKFSRTSQLTAHLGPTREERAIADAGVEVAAAIVVVVAARVAKLRIRTGLSPCS
jgi:hypothetical protein